MTTPDFAFARKVALEGLETNTRRLPRLAAAREFVEAETPEEREAVLQAGPRPVRTGLQWWANLLPDYADAFLFLKDEIDPYDGTVFEDLYNERVR